MLYLLIYLRISVIKQEIFSLYCEKSFPLRLYHFSFPLVPFGAASVSGYYGDVEIAMYILVYFYIAIIRLKRPNSYKSRFTIAKINIPCSN